MKKFMAGLAFCLLPLPTFAGDHSNDITLEEVNRVKKITPKELKVKLDKGERIVIVDVRTGGSWDNSKVKVKRAVRIPFNKVAGSIEQIPFGSAVVTYCT